MRLEFWKRVCGPLTVAVVVLGSWGCGPMEELPASPALEEQEQGLWSVNGFSVNGFSVNGFSVNGFSVNGLSANGLALRGLTSATLSSEEFAAWFAQDPALTARVMHYVVQCAVPFGQTRSYTDRQTGQQYTWRGRLGLAPGWANGAPANRAEQQVITACLTAHVNRYGLSLPISVLGRTATGERIPFTRQELGIFSAREACFFGNLFTQEGLFFGVDRPFTNEATFLTRACAGLGVGGNDPATSCAPLQFIGACSKSCLPDKRGPFYRTCFHDGVAYQALTTRMRRSDFEQLFPEE